MKVKLTKTFGDNRIEFLIEQGDTTEVFTDVALLISPDQCGLCQKTNITYEASNPRKKDGSGSIRYIKRRCQDCRAESTMGNFQDGGHFWKRWEIWTGNKEASQETTNRSVDIDMGVPQSTTGPQNYVPTAGTPYVDRHAAGDAEQDAAVLGF